MKQKVSIKINGNLEEVEVDFTEEQWEALRKQMNIKYNHTGYERAKKYFCLVEKEGKIIANEYPDSSMVGDEGAFASGNYFTDRQIAEDRAKLFNILNAMYRWVAENTEPVDMRDGKKAKYTANYDHDTKKFCNCLSRECQEVIPLHFATMNDCNRFIEQFREELKWLSFEFTYRL